MRIAVITIDDPRDKKAWSGILSKVFLGLEEKYGKDNVISIGPLTSFGLKALLAIGNYILFKLFGSRYNYSHSIVLSFVYSKVVEMRLKKHDFDLIFAIGSTNALAYLKNKGNVPIVLFIDATFESLNDYYFKNVLGLSILESNNIEERALKKCSHVFFASRWAQDEALKFYELHKFCDFSVLKFGSNLDNSSFRHTERKDSDPFSLLFVGVDWERKGGDILLRSFEKLQNLGYNVSLTIVGCVPPGVYDSLIKVIKFLNKNNKEDLLILEDLYNSSDIFVLPTRAECAGIVFAEASSFGLPIISVRTGGVGCYVEDGNTGFLVELTDDENIITEKIASLIDNEILYKRFSINSYAKYEKELNWSKFFIGLDNVFKSQIRI